MIERAFRHRSGRVVSLGRLILAATALVAMTMDPSQPAVRQPFGYTLLVAFSAWAAAILVLTWANWWLDHRLAPFTHATDVIVFGILVLATEGNSSPFFLLFTFVVMAAAIRWGWRETAFTGAVVILLFYGWGLFALADASSADFQAFLVRGVFLVVLSLILTWFGVNRESTRPVDRRPIEMEAEGSDPPIGAAMELAASRLRAKRILFAWWDREEPWTNVWELSGTALERRRFGPTELSYPIGDDAGEGPLLFDRPRGRCLTIEPPRDRHPYPIQDPIAASFAERFGLRAGLVVRIRSGDHQGEMFALGVPGLCTDDLVEARKLGRQISSAFDRALTIAASEEAAVVRARLSLARDLHDSVVQALAGAAFQIEAIRKRLQAGVIADEQLIDLQQGLANEQRNLRHYIAGLGSGRGSTRPVDLGKGIADLSLRISRQWGIRCSAHAESDGIQISAWAEHELHQLVREAAANAVRHGKASSLTIELSSSKGQLRLAVSDNGAGFPIHGELDERTLRKHAICPLSLNERVKHLGGRMSVSSTPVGSRISVTLPLEGIG